MPLFLDADYPRGNMSELRFNEIGVVRIDQPVIFTLDQGDRLSNQRPGVLNLLEPGTDPHHLVIGLFKTCTT